MNFYFQASEILDRLDAKQGSIKGIISSVPDKDRKRTAALVIETLKYKAILTDIIEAAQLLKVERKKLTSPNLILLLVHDLLFSKNGIQAGDGPIKQAVLRHKTRLNSELVKQKVKRGAKSNKDLAQFGDDRAELIPRYVRVNRVLSTTDTVVNTLFSQGFTLSSPFESVLGFAKDEHIPDLLLFSPQASFSSNPLYLDGSIILQDKASCFPATVLAPPATPEAVVIDATAAPGNKTSHLCALMNNLGKLYAFERDHKRFGTLQKMLSVAGCTNVEPVNADFLMIDPMDPKYAKATHILLDPSCSGSGIVNRLDYLLETEEENETEADERLQRLSAFQLLMIKHAMKFPNVSKIVYSTCSIHAAENEHVVQDALKSEEANGHFHLAPSEQVLPNWKRRGIPSEMDQPSDASSLVRCLPGEDATNGFFVSCFLRLPDMVHSKKRKSSQEAATGGPKKKKRKKKKVNVQT
ncbi:S-adenosyl-L-methionine-dependent methyltransferase [Mycena floridula]|nr:S-adenosyl-L-methionine-dependent methyltransferase [Mycena floridula]